MCGGHDAGGYALRLRLLLLLQACLGLDTACCSWRRVQQVLLLSARMLERDEPACCLITAAATVMCCALPCGGSLGSAAPAHCPRWAWPSSKRHPFCPGHTWASCTHSQVQVSIAKIVSCILTSASQVVDPCCNCVQHCCWLLLQHQIDTAVAAAAAAASTAAAVAASH